MQETSGTVQLAAASLLGRLQVQALHGPRVTLTLQRLLPPGLVAAIQASPVVLHCLGSIPVCYQDAPLTFQRTALFPSRILLLCCPKCVCCLIAASLSKVVYCIVRHM